jgi:hypothetical protein
LGSSASSRSRPDYTPTAQQLDDLQRCAVLPEREFVFAEEAPP